MHTIAEIDKMGAGPELDLLIAEKVMGYPIIDVTPPCDHNVTPYVTHIAVFSPTQIHYHRALGNEKQNYMWGIWQPSTDIAQAWEVVEKLRDSFHYVSIIFAHEGNFQVQDPRYSISISEFDEKLNQRIEVGLNAAPTAPLAICRAALKAICTP